MDWPNFVTPAVITVVLNGLFFLFFQSRHLNYLEKLKVAYSGIYKERVDIYKQIMELSYDLKKKIENYVMQGENVENELGYEVMLDYNKFIRYYNINRPFLSLWMIRRLNTLRDEYGGVIDDAYSYYINDKRAFPPEKKDELFNNLMKAYKKIKDNHPFEEIEKAIIIEMKEHLRVDRI